MKIIDRKRSYKYKLLKTAIGLIILNVSVTIVLFMTNKWGATHLNGEHIEAHSPELLKSMLIGELVGFPLVCAIIGALIALFINKETPYRIRFLKSFLITLIILFGIYLFINIFAVIRTIVL